MKYGNIIFDFEYFKKGEYYDNQISSSIVWLTEHACIGHEGALWAVNETNDC